MRPPYDPPPKIGKLNKIFAENLKAELIIPRTPTPPPLEERPVDTLSLEELRELQRRAKKFRVRIAMAD